jgi:16S rRNA (guanine527-N7)-methyltransferase
VRDETSRRPTGARLAALLERLELPAGLGEPLARLVELLSGDPLAPTAVRDPERIVDVHLADSLVALALPEVASAATIVDVGSGAGLPGLPLALALPRARVVLLESSARKCEFLTRAASAAGATNVEVVAARAESWHEGLDAADAVTARAVAPLDVVAEYAAPLLRLGGAAVLWRGRREPAEERAGARAAALLGLVAEEPRPVTPYPGARHHHLHVLRKVSPTPRGYPRRAGIARKRPLGRASDRTRR